MTTNTLTAWSYSRLSCYEQCPRLAKFRYIDKKKEPQGPAMARGNKIHLEAQRFLDGTTDEFPESCANFESAFRHARTFNPIVEQKWSFDKNWKPTGYFAKNCWVRVIVDLNIIYSHGVADLIDLKTGKKYDDHASQLQLFAGATVKMFPTEVTKSVVVRNWYLDIEDDPRDPGANELIAEYSREEALGFVDDFSERAHEFLTTERFPPRQSWKCRFCHFNRDSTGDCEYG